MSLKELDISPAELKYVRGLAKEYRDDGYSADEARKKAIQQMLKESEEEVASIEKQIKEQP